MAKSAAFIFPVLNRFGVRLLRAQLPSGPVSGTLCVDVILMNDWAHIGKRLATSPSSIARRGIDLLDSAESSDTAMLVADIRHDDLVNEHVVAVFGVVKMNLRILSNLRRFDHFAI
jgi:hypothetical protein